MKSRKILSPKTVDMMLTPQNEAFGLGLRLTGRGSSARFFHDGRVSGFRSAMVAFTEGGKGAVVMINSQGQPILYEILRAIAKEYNWLGYLPRERTVVNVDPKAYDAYVGRYLDPDQPDGVINISVKDGKLLFNGDSLLAESETRFFNTTNSDYTFVKDENGDVKELLVQFVDPPLKLVAKRIR